VEQTGNLRLKGELADRNSRIAAMTGQYEGQIGEIKEVIAAKDEELRRMSSVLIVSDYDMVRLKVVNELELGHREEVERLNTEINRKVGEIAELRSKCGLLNSKYEHLSEELKKQG
jgi:phage host-nuclease inhibitor protein Gam